MIPGSAMNSEASEVMTLSERARNPWTRDHLRSKP
jgi:hypothetical protein